MFVVNFFFFLWEVAVKGRKGGDPQKRDGGAKNERKPFNKNKR
jgi:hypothetical protein